MNKDQTVDLLRISYELSLTLRALSSTGVYFAANPDSRYTTKYADSVREYTNRAIDLVRELDVSTLSSSEFDLAAYILKASSCVSEVDAFIGHFNQFMTQLTDPTIN